MQNYIRLLSYENAMKVIQFVDSLNNYDDYANITSGGVSLKSTEENHSKILDYLKSLNVRFELTDKHPEVVNKEIVSNLRNAKIIESKFVVLENIQTKHRFWTFNNERNLNII